MKLEKQIRDFKYEKNITVNELMNQYSNLGFQASDLGKAAEVIKKMKNDNAKIFLAFTSNMASSGLRGLFAQLIKMKFVDVVVTTVGSIEEDFVKAHGKKMYVGSFDADDVKLGKEGINRLGNIFVPNEFYTSFEDLFQPILEKLYNAKKVWSAKDFVFELGKFAEDENSILYQATKNNVPIYCPAITDGALGMQFYFFKQNHKDFEITNMEDLKSLIEESLQAEKTGAIVLGGGVPKHQVILSNLLRDGMDYAVYITTARASSGSLSGATTEEAKSWGKIKGEADAITVNGEATILFPLLMCKVLDDLN